MHSRRNIPWSLIACTIVIASAWGVARHRLDFHIPESHKSEPTFITTRFDENSTLDAESKLPTAESKLPTSEQFVKLRNTSLENNPNPNGDGAPSRSKPNDQSSVDLENVTVELPTTELTTPHGTFYGLPMARFSDQFWLLRNDGAIQSIPNDIIQSERSIPVEFRAISIDQLMVRLRDEFGRQYLVHHQKPYVFVAKSQHFGQWGTRFRALHESMRRVCMTKGLKGTEIEFPLVAIVFGSKEEFLRYAARGDVSLPSNCVGYYSQRDNRIALYEDESESTAQDTLDTISHEAAHQLAFNMGLHRRCASSGLWLPEGFATLFEAPAFSNISREGRSSWPAARIETWRRIQDDREQLAETLESIVRNDNLFTHDPDLAYTVSWALTYHLMEKEPRRFADYIHQTSQLPLGHELAPNDRWFHFRSVFGREPAQFAPLIQKHLAGVR